MAEKNEKSKVARYVSKYAKLKIVLKGTRAREVDGKIMVEQGDSVQFNNGYFETSDMELAKMLESRKDFSVVFYRIPDTKTTDEAKEALNKTLEEKNSEIEKLKKELADERVKNSVKGEDKGKNKAEKKSENKNTPKF
jgi:ribosomal protein L29